MHWKQIAGSENQQRTYAVVFQTGDEVMAGLRQFIQEQRAFNAGQIVAIGAFSDAVVAYFDWQTKRYNKIPVPEQVEVLLLAGDVSEDQDGQPKVHVHVVVGKADGTAHGGHLVEAHVRPTLEVIFTEAPEHLRRRFDPTTGLSLLQV